VADLSARLTAMVGPYGGGVPGSQRAASGVWSDLVGQPHAVAILAAAARAAAEPTGDGSNGAAMSQAWLLTGPPGSGRSNAARAFAAALQCIGDATTGEPAGSGCGRCQPCRTVLAGTHPDVLLIRTAVLSLKIKEIRDLVLRAAMSPTVGRRLVVVVEDADRLTEDAADALLKSIEEPPPHTVWALCAPAVDDVAPTIRSRCRHLLLRTPTAAAVADFLVTRHGADPALALLGARCAQGHIGRARALATDPEVRARHDAVVGLPQGVTGPAAAARAAADLVATATADADAASTGSAAAASDRLRHQLGLDEGTRPDRAAQAALRDLADEQETMAKRAVRDHLDRALVDLAAFYRDVLATQFGAVGAAVNEHRRADLDVLAAASRPEDILRRIDAVLAAREAIAANGAPLLAVEAMALALVP
jgi:DNA polymerase-3 subunit delta'